jgi:uncharacterized protein (TIGR02145 family)
MDRNLGATEAANSLAGRGLFYQWGRKDPFPGGMEGIAGYAALNKFYGINEPGTAGRDSILVNNTSADEAGINDGILESIRKPTTFFAVVVWGIYDWLPARKNDLWNATGNKKTIYDPCPKGWRVPIRLNNNNTLDDDFSPWKGYESRSGVNTWGAWAANDPTGGMDFGTNALYPASGYRFYSRGWAANTGNTNYIWCATPSNDGGFCLLFQREGGVDPTILFHKASGFSVRCVQEYPIEP